MTIRSVRLKLTFLYVVTVALLLAIFIGADMIGLRRNLMQQVMEHSLTEEAMHASWVRAITEHILLAAGLTLLVFIIGYGVIRRAFKPVREMARTAKTISAENLSLRVDAKGDKAELGELADTINEMISRLERSFSQTRRFSADAAHELFTPLAVLRGELEVALRRERSTEEYQQTLPRMLVQVNRITSIVEDLLLLSRADAGQLSPAAETSTLDDVVILAFEGLQPLAQERGIDLRLGRIDEVQVEGDAPTLRRMVDNLMGNALKYTEDGGEVAVRLEAAGDRYTLTISDTGVGIPEESLPHVFERFYRVDKSRTRAAGGVGLGLSIVREIAESLGIEIQLQSVAGEGTAVALKGRTTQNKNP